jgi:hypothetical protein
MTYSERVVTVNCITILCELYTAALVHCLDKRHRLCFILCHGRTQRSWPTWRWSSEIHSERRRENITFIECAQLNRLLPPFLPQNGDKFNLHDSLPECCMTIDKMNKSKSNFHSFYINKYNMIGTDSAEVSHYQVNSRRFSSSKPTE